MKTNKKLTVTVGIPAYNEEANIGKLIESILSQKQSNFVLKKIIIVSDQSTDKTNFIVSSFKKNKVLLMRNKTRLGQALSQNKISKKINSDILVLLNADMLIIDLNFLSKLLEPFTIFDTLGIVCPMLEPVSGHNFFERIINFSVKFKDDIFCRYRDGNNMYTCRGACRAFHRRFYQSFVWPKLTAEDTYTYLTCIQQGFLYKLCKEATIFYRSPNNFRDHLRQSKRFSSHKVDLAVYFDQRFVQSEYKLPKDLVLYSLIKFIMLNPFLMISYVLIVLRTKFTQYKIQGVAWEPSASTKSLDI